MKRRNKVNGLSLIIMCLFTIVAIQLSAGSAAVAEQLNISACGMGCSWYTMGAGLAEIWNKEIPGLTVTVRGDGESQINPKWLSSGKVPISFVTLDVFYLARQGKAPYTKKYDMSHVKSMVLTHSSPGHMVAMRKSGITKLADFKGKKVALGPRSSATNQRTRWIFALFGINENNTKFEDIGEGQALEAMADGRIDAVVDYTGPPNSDMVNISTNEDVYFIDHTDDEIMAIRKKYPFFRYDPVAPGVYRGIEMHRKWLGVPGALMVLDSVSEKTVYQMVKLIDGHKKDLLKVHKLFRKWQFSPDVEKVTGQPLHPGALKYYKEKGYIK